LGKESGRVKKKKEGTGLWSLDALTGGEKEICSGWWFLREKVNFSSMGGKAPGGKQKKGKKKITLYLSKAFGQKGGRCEEDF